MHTSNHPWSRRGTGLTGIVLGSLMAVLNAQVATADYHGGGQTTARVAVQEFAFAPTTVTVAAGASVVWEVRKDPEQHTVTPVEANSFTASGQLFAGDDYAVRFPDPGRYDYVCSLHPFMTGTVIVEAVVEASATTSSTAAPPASTAPSPTFAEPVESASASTTGIVILALVLIIGVASIGTLIQRRPARHGGGDGPAD